MPGRDVVWVVAEHHAILRWLGDRIASASTPAHRLHLFDELAKALGGHLRAVDEAVVPALRDCGWRDVPSTLLIGHVDLKHRLADALTVRDEPMALEKQLLVLIPKLADHLEREGTHLVPLLRRGLDRSARASLGAQVASQFGMLFDRGVAGTEIPEGPQELMEEARIVFRSFNQH